MQSHASARTNSDDYVLSAFITFEKLPTLLYELLLAEAWRENVFPLISDTLAQNGSTSCMRAYFVFHHEEVIANILESFLYHDYAAESLGDSLVDLVDYCARCVARLIALNSAFQSGSPAVAGMWDSGDALDSRAAAAALAAESADPATAATRQMRGCANQTVYRLGVTAVSILRYISDYATKMPLSVLTRLLDTHDVSLLMVPLIENPPWVRRGTRSVLVPADKEGEAHSSKSKTVWQKYVDHKWVDVEPRDLLKLTKLEGQPWLTLHALLLEPDCRRRYALTSHRRGTLMRVRKYLNEVLHDQLPVLQDVQRMLDETAVMPAGALDAADSDMKAFLVETTAGVQEAVTREALTAPGERGGGKWTWEDVSVAVLETSFRKRRKMSPGLVQRLASASAHSGSMWPDSEEDGDLARLAHLYEAAGFEEAMLEPPKCAKCGKAATKRCSRCHNEWYCGRACQVDAWKGHKALCDLVSADKGGKGKGEE